MPELPEMETYRTLLTEKMAGKTITKVEINREKSVNTTVDFFIHHVTGSRVDFISRRAKHLLFHLDNNYVLLLHLMLGGWMYWGTPADRPSRNFQVILSFGEYQLYFIGLRLGYLHLIPSAEVEERFAALGPEPLSPTFTAQALMERFKGKRGKLKMKLVDQSWISGIGNCYSDEICFHAGLLPDKAIQSLTNTQMEQLSRSIPTVLQEAIRWGGYMEYPLFKEDRLTGGYNDQCKVYDREGEPCFRCSQFIQKEEISSRKTFFCTHCQE
ncbi:bifunctional DNA-formamidopyrimidine glycosylase/DNA-(apurinic or apyrimidinic site) lyase [Ammoniphilus sp. YIM 78166]|uniref:bifunctional DNA-formamidopyrimidine glycosylase/DNA-(apurinic or apyrimidinic site) lyase n=1 Tax=Ammoniphilus sp. YIM 78166 TaxID=1644106 RepID=UPI00106F9823|nr:bifunctional DNA-formamidopyrimidine glycosylase/DNA-(apurinic or apyrimidinic site) lyase [Ammoniphilus sp. YIM 78166]